MRKWTYSGLIAFAAAALMILALSQHSNGQGHAMAGPRVVSALGVSQVQGRDVFVDVLAVVPPGQDEDAVVAEALGEQGARPASPRDLLSENFTTEGLLWNQFFDTSASNNFVSQYYNPANDPTGGGGQTALTNAETAWSTVATSSFAFSFGGQTNRCPSLVKECPGPQSYDGKTDVAWLPLGGCCTLGVTWYSTSVDEADMALNTAFSWNTGCANQASRYDAQTVFTHENGHVAGLGHSNDPSAVMYAYYGGARCALAQDDINGISSLYPGSGSSTPTDTPTPTATSTTGGPTPTSTPCPPGLRKQGRC